MIPRTTILARAAVCGCTAGHGNSVPGSAGAMDAITLLNDGFTAKATVLIEGVRQHVTEAERDPFPQVHKAMDSKALRQLARNWPPRNPGRPRTR